MAVDLAPEAFAARRRAEQATGRKGGYLGRELIANAGTLYWEAHKLIQRAERHGSAKQRRKLRERARQALMVSAVSLRVAERCRLDSGYLHQLSMEQLDRIKQDVIALYHDHPDDELPGAKLAVDTLQRLRDQKHRTGEEA